MERKSYTCDYKIKLDKGYSCRVTGESTRRLCDLSCSLEIKDECAEMFGKNAMQSLRQHNSSSRRDDPGHVGTDSMKIAENKS